MSSQSSTRKIAEKIAVINDRSVFLGFDVYMTLELLKEWDQRNEVLSWICDIMQLDVDTYI